MNEEAMPLVLDPYSPNLVLEIILPTLFFRFNATLYHVALFRQLLVRI
jgi:hypothetical protein